jgi:hypothetical protein
MSAIHMLTNPQILQQRIEELESSVKELFNNNKFLENKIKTFTNENFTEEDNTDCIIKKNITETKYKDGDEEKFKVDGYKIVASYTGRYDDLKNTKIDLNQILSKGILGTNVSFNISNKDDNVTVEEMYCDDEDIDSCRKRSCTYTQVNNSDVKHCLDPKTNLLMSEI